QVRKIAIERSPVAALDVHVIFATEDDRPKAVPLRFIQVSARRYLVRECGEHRFNRGLHGPKLHWWLRPGKLDRRVACRNDGATALRRAIPVARRRRFRSGDYWIILHSFTPSSPVFSSTRCKAERAANMPIFTSCHT